MLFRSFGFNDANRLADQHLRYENLVAAPLDFAVAADLAHGCVRPVAGLPQPGWERPGRRPVDGGGRALPEGFVGAIEVIIVAEGRHATLLLPIGGGRRRGDVLLHGPVHALVPAVLLGMAGLDALRPNAELQEPHRQSRQAAGAGAGDRGLDLLGIVDGLGFRVVAETDKNISGLCFTNSLTTVPFPTPDGPAKTINEAFIN